MRIATLVLAFCVLTGACVVAQQAENSNRSLSQQPGASVSASNLTVSGCVSGGQSRYTLSQKGTGALFEPQADPEQLTKVRGKLVEVTAIEQAPSDTRGVNALPRLKVSQMRVVAEKCPEQKAVQGKNTQAGTNANPPTAATPEFGAPGADNQTPPQVGNNPTTWGNGAHGAPSPGTGNPPSRPEPQK
jgi:hypothetical protein